MSRALHAVFCLLRPFLPGGYPCAVFPFFLQETLFPAPCHIGQGKVPVLSKILICDKYGLTYL